MKEYTVVLQKIRHSISIMEAKNKQEAGEKAMEIYKEGYADWGDEDVEVKEIEEN